MRRAGMLCKNLIQNWKHQAARANQLGVGRMNIHDGIAAPHYNPEDFVEAYTKHRCVFPLYEMRPDIGRDSFISPTATIGSLQS